MIKEEIVKQQRWIITHLHTAICVLYHGARVCVFVKDRSSLCVSRGISRLVWEVERPWPLTRKRPSLINIITDPGVLTFGRVFDIVRPVRQRLSKQRLASRCRLSLCFIRRSLNRRHPKTGLTGLTTAWSTQWSRSPVHECSELRRHPS